MSLFFTIILFVFALLLLSWIASRLVSSLIKVARFLGWREFVISFFVMSLANIVSNFFIDFTAVLKGVPELALGEILGGNLVDLTFVLAAAAFFTKRGILADSKMVQKSATFTTIIAILPLFLIYDGNLSRFDGWVLIAAFIAYTIWLFSDRERFTKLYRAKYGNKDIKTSVGLVISVIKIVFFLLLLTASAQLIVWSVQNLAVALGASLSLMGIVILGFGNASPEIYFSIASARKEENWMILGNLMGILIMCSTLLLGLIALFSPFYIADMSPFINARVFLVIAAITALFFIKTGRKITKKEGLLLLSLYIIFLIIEIFVIR